MDFNSDYYKEQLKINKIRLKNTNNEEMKLFYKNKVKKYLDLYKIQKQLEQKRLEEDKLENQFNTLEQKTQIKDEEQERFEREKMKKEELEKKERLEKEELEKKERLEKEELEKKERLEKEELEEKERLEEKRLEQERLDKIKYKQQRKNLRKREKSYEKKTGNKYHPLVIDDEDKNDNNLISQDITSQDITPTPENITSENVVQPTPLVSLPIVSPPKLVPTNKKTRKTRKIPKSSPVYEGIEMTNFNKPKISVKNVKNVKNATRKIQNVGFTETLKQTINVQQKLKSLDPSICKDIFINGSKTNNKYFYPSEFPKLTKIKPISVLTKKGGRNNKRKTFKKRYKK
jgi:hypothetical protein